MPPHGVRTCLGILLFAAVATTGSRSAPGQVRVPLRGFLPSADFELSESIQLDRADSAVRAELERADAQLADGQWDEGVRTLREVMENSGDKLMEITQHRHISLRSYCQLKIAALPPEALALYRRRVDAVAETWYARGVARRDRGLLLNVVEQALASSWGDDALLALGELSLQAGQYASARDAWERIIPRSALRDAPSDWLGYPDTELDLAGVRARLVLVSILEGSLGRAHGELDRFVELHAEAEGRFGGREVNYATALKELLAEAPTWPEREPSGDWPTFAGAPSRHRVAAPGPQVGRVAWRMELPSTARPDAGRDNGRTAGPAAADDPGSPLSYHPVVAGDLVLVNTQSEIRAFDRRTRQAAWGLGAIFRDPLDPSVRESFVPPDTLGVPRFTLTVFGDRVYAKMGSAVTSRPQESAYAVPSGYLVCLDLAAQGRLAWKALPEDKQWAFEGSPVCDGRGVYVAMRHSELGPQAHAYVACFDPETGRLLWRTFVCGAETRARGLLHQATHNLLALEGDTLYYNTNLGAVAALSTHDGRIRWVSLYPRAQKGSLLSPAPHWSRDLTPCLYDRGTLLVAPSDSPSLFAFDAATGRLLWQSGPELEDVVHLLGVAGDRLIASGERLYWIALSGPKRGSVERMWPQGTEKLGHGRGTLAGDLVYWPTRHRVLLFDQASGRQVRAIDLGPLGLGGGNLIVSAGELLIADGDSVTALAPGAPGEPERGELTDRAARSGDGIEKAARLLRGS